MASSTELKLEPESKQFIQDSDLNPESTNSAFWSFVSRPSSLFFSTLNLFRPFAPQLIPLLVCLVLIPVIILFSLFSGYYVWKNVAVRWESPVYLLYGDGVSPYAEVLLPQLSAQHPYDISLHLEIPATDANFALGNFMTTLTLSTAANKTLTSTRRPYIALPPPKGSFSFLSSSPRVVNLDIPLLFSYVTGASRVIAKVDIGRNDGWRSIGGGEGRELSVVSASLRGTVKRTGIRGLVASFPVTSGLISFITFLAVCLTILVACLLPAIQWRFDGEAKITSTANNKGGGSDPSDDRLFRSQRRSRGKAGSGSRSETRKTNTKTEDMPFDFPLAASVSDPTISRRRSRGFDEFDS